MNNNDSQEIAADLAANAALLEMAEGLGLSVILDRVAPFTVAEAAAAADISETAVLSFPQALASAGLVEQGADGQHFTSCPNMADLRYEAGYLPKPTFPGSGQRPPKQEKGERKRVPRGSPRKTL